MGRAFPFESYAIWHRPIPAAGVEGIISVAIRRIFEIGEEAGDPASNLRGGIGVSWFVDGLPEGKIGLVLRVIGACAYHFWMAAMTPLRRVSGNQYLHRKSDTCRNAVRRKIAACHRHIQLGLIAQGLLQILSATKPTLVWQSFGSWIRTVRPGLAPSEQVVAIALRNTLPEFLATTAKPSILVKFIRDRLDLSRTEGTSLAA